MNDILEKVSLWQVCQGFATGNDKSGNDGWFSISYDFNTKKSLRKAIEDVRKFGYSQSDDICADWTFWVRDLTTNTFYHPKETFEE